MASEPLSTQNCGCRWAWALVTSQIGAKLVMAVTGLVLALFVLGHMAGNLQFFLGAEAINDYAELLQAKPPVLWAVRLTMLTAVAIHIVTGLSLKWANWSARPQGYEFEQTVEASLASRYMVLTGVVAAGFIVYHILHLTVGVTNPAHYDVHEASGRHDVFAMTVLGFENPLISGAYIVAMVGLGLHLSHAMTSVFQTFGVNHPRLTRPIAWFGPAFAILVAGGLALIPISVLVGLIRVGGGGQ